MHDLGGTGPTVLAVHANGFHGRVLGPLARGGWACGHWVGIDLRGHGDTVTPVDLDYAWDGFADDVLAVTDDLGLGSRAGPATGTLLGFGHSVGGAALLAAARRRPGTFARLYVYEPIVFPDRAAAAPAQDRFAELTARRRPVFDSRSAALENFSTKPPLATLDRRALEAYVDHGFTLRRDGTLRIKCAPEVEAAIYLRAADHGLFDVLGEVACPVTVACGSDEGLSAAKLAPVVAARLPDARLELLARLGHLGPLEDPDRVAAAFCQAVRGG